MRIVRGLDLVHGLNDGTFLIYEIRSTNDTHVGTAVIFLLLPDIVKLNDLMIRIRENGERKRVLCLKVLMGLYAVLADTEDYGTLLLNLRVSLGKAAGLLRTAGGVILRVEIENDLLAPVILQGMGLAVLIRQSEIGGFRSDFEHNICSFLCQVFFFDYREEGPARASPQRYLYFLFLRRCRIR